MKIIYHHPTGTWFVADDAVSVIDTDDMPNGGEDIDQLLEQDGDEIGEQYGVDAMSIIAPHIEQAWRGLIVSEINAYIDAYEFSSESDVDDWKAVLTSKAAISRIYDTIVETFMDPFMDALSEAVQSEAGAKK